MYAYNRRKILRTAGAVAIGAGLAGCADQGPDEGAGDEDQGEDVGEEEGEEETPEEEEEEEEETPEDGEDDENGDEDEAADGDEPDYGDWFDDVENYDGTEDMTGEDEVEVAVGAGDDGLRFDPPAIQIDAGTTVVWEWTGEGGEHNVVDDDGEYESEITDEEGFTFEHTFEAEGTSRYFCEPHRAVGMKGAVDVV